MSSYTVLLLKHLETAPFKKAHEGNIRLVRDPTYKTLSQIIDNFKGFFSYRHFLQLPKERRGAVR